MESGLFFHRSFVALMAPSWFSLGLLGLCGALLYLGLLWIWEGKILLGEGRAFLDAVMKRQPY
jgi:hypothetical protein